MDDDLAVRATFEEILFTFGVETATARSVAEVWSSIAEFCPSLVLTDLHMDGGGGLSVLEAVRASSATTPVVPITGASDSIHPDSGFVAVLRKPVGAEELRHVVATFGEVARL